MEKYKEGQKELHCVFVDLMANLIKGAKSKRTRPSGTRLYGSRLYRMNS